jgi:branched-chain amino acid aminotransferase
MGKVNLEWENLGFSYSETKYRYVSTYKDGVWGVGSLISDPNIVMNESAIVLQYAQTVFEGLKAYQTITGEIVTFRTDLNANRFQESAKRLGMPPVSEEMFLEGIDETVRANADYVPPYGSGAALYVRPFMFGVSPLILIVPATEYQFRVFTTPVGPYFKGGVKPISLWVADFDRAAPRGTGHIKAGLNYAMGMYPSAIARQKGFADNLYLDSTTRSKVEETSGANFLFITKDKKVVTPSSPTILPSVTRRSLQYVAKEYLGLEVEEREVYFEELKDFAECGVCGTAAIIAPVGRIASEEGEILFPSGMEEMGEITKQLYDTLVGIQFGTIKAPEGWIRKIVEK